MTETTKLYDGRVVLKFEENRHRYTISVDRAPEVFTPSVTGITGFMDDGKSRALMGWAVRMGGDALRARLTKMVAERTQLDEIAVEKLVAAVTSAHTNRSGAAATVGSKVHEWVEAAIKAEIAGKKVPAMPVNKQVRHGAAAFCGWRASHEIEFLLSEQKVYSLAHHYVGTFDFLAVIDGVLTLGDLKTSNYMLAEYWLQTAGYQGAFEEEYDNKIADRLILKVGKDEPTFETFSARAKGRDDAADMAAFLALRAAYKWAKAA